MHFALVVFRVQPPNADGSVRQVDIEAVEPAMETHGLERTKSVREESKNSTFSLSVRIFLVEASTRAASAAGSWSSSSPSESDSSAGISCANQR